MTTPRILHYPGSKWSMAEWIMSFMPPHRIYLEPFFGSGAVFFNKEPSALETINDLDGDVVNLFRVIRDRPEELARMIQCTPWAREEYDICNRPESTDSELERARKLLVRCWQSVRVKTGSKSGWKCRTTADNANRVKQWNDLPAKVITVAERLKEVQIEQRSASELIARYAQDDVMIYADPPYFLDARNGAIYNNELSNEDHAELIELLDAHPGPVILSGYANPLYDDRLLHWRREERQQVIETGQTRTEVLWINPIAAEHAGRQLALF